MCSRKLKIINFNWKCRRSMQKFFKALLYTTHFPSLTLQLCPHTCGFLSLTWCSKQDCPDTIDGDWVFVLTTDWCQRICESRDCITISGNIFKEQIKKMENINLDILMDFSDGLITFSRHKRQLEPPAIRAMYEEQIAATAYFEQKWCSNAQKRALIIRNQLYLCIYISLTLLYIKIALNSRSSFLIHWNSFRKILNIIVIMKRLFDLMTHPQNRDII